MDRIKKLGKWLHELVMDYYPFVICVTGGGIFSIAVRDDDLYARIFFMAVAFAAWLFALDLIATRSKANAKSEVAAQFLTFLTKGGDTEINIYQHKERD
ncbi:hypothetical protein KUG47_12035 [Falsochrobactrum sp. TDYN1]|uniref:Uncharacterized protein n=1 Tax=Falsochrobactrum tianjinense TaxID=2706015 RepID=A0A949UVN2_9HYPH|nr:hypothetical protein [Falsochrobactrum sp. TDYN1]MBV2144223.1 hypothetical protein [Falsochrobactrum sp. TDYN1]